MLDYIINPIKMGGLVKAVSGDRIKVHLHGRLGVITVPRDLVSSDERIEPGHETEFYFSYIQLVEDPYDYDDADMKSETGMIPCLLGGWITEVNDTAAKVEIMDGLGTIAVPRRWYFTDLPLEVGRNTEFYFSRMKVIGKRDIPAESI